MFISSVILRKGVCFSNYGTSLLKAAVVISVVFRTDAMLLTLTLRRLMSYIYGAPILDVSRSHTTTQHSR